jgi:hypothetical protein
VTSTEYVPASRPWADSRQPWTIISLAPPDVGGARCTVALWVDWLTTLRTRSACAIGPNSRNSLKRRERPRRQPSAFGVGVVGPRAVPNGSRYQPIRPRVFMLLAAPGAEGHL